MIRRFEKNDIDVIMQIWKNENIKAHKFILKEYWENNYNFVKEVLPNAEVYVYVAKEKIVGFVGLDNDYIEGIFVDTINFYKKNDFVIASENIDKNTGEIEYTMTWNKY